MNSSDSPDTTSANAPERVGAAAVLAREAGVPFQPQLGNDTGVDPIDEWLRLMEVVEMLCPVWPVREAPMQCSHWRL